MTSTNRRVLILSCSGGAGHVRAAEALHQWAAGHFPRLETEHHDILAFTNSHFKRLYARGYFHAVQHARHLWSMMYEHSDARPRPKHPLVRIFDHFNYGSYAALIRERSPAAILCTHFLPFLAIDRKIHDLRIPVPFYAVGTDFNLHSLWVSRGVRRYFVFSDETSALLAGKGIPTERISVTGIPVMKEFSVAAGKRQSRRAIGVPERSAMILVLSGGEGMGRIRSIVEAVLETAAASLLRATVVVIAGKNARLAQQLRSLPCPENVVLRVEGFVTTMHDFMHAADLVVTKPGGLTSSEALACGLPMIVTEPIPGQERHNADVLLEKGIGLIATDPHQLRYKLRLALRDRSWRTSASAAAKALGRPLAAKHILRHVWEDIATEILL